MLEKEVSASPCLPSNKSHPRYPGIPRDTQGTHTGLTSIPLGDDSSPRGVGLPSAIGPRCSVAHPRRMNDMACECRATMEEAREEAEAEAHPASRGVAQRGWPWGKSQEVKGGNTLA